MKHETSKGRTFVPLAALAAAAFVVTLGVSLFIRLRPELTRPTKLEPPFQLPAPLELASLPTAARFDYPIASENGAFAYNAQPFTQNRHLGDDLNGIGGENSDLGDPVYAVADGRILLAREGGPGWGNAVIVLHAYEEGGTRKFVQSFTATSKKSLSRRGKTCDAASRLRPSELRTGNIGRICISRCANLRRPLSVPVIGRTRAAGLTPVISSRVTAVLRKVMWVGAARTRLAVELSPSRAQSRDPVSLPSR